VDCISRLGFFGNYGYRRVRDCDSPAFDRQRRDCFPNIFARFHAAPDADSDFGFRFDVDDEAAKFGQSAGGQVKMDTPFNKSEDAVARAVARQNQATFHAEQYPAGKRPMERGRTAVWQARLVLFVMINVAQLWILSATVEAALARQYKQLLPLVISSGVCWVIALTIFLWWKPASRRHTSTGYLRGK